MKIRGEAYTHAGRTFSGSQRGVITPASGEIELPESVQAIIQLCYPLPSRTDGSTVGQDESVQGYTVDTQGGGAGNETLDLVKLLRGVWQFSGFMVGQSSGTAPCAPVNQVSSELQLVDPFANVIFYFGALLFRAVDSPVTYNFSGVVIHIPSDNYVGRMIHYDPVTVGCTSRIAAQIYACRLL